MKKQNTLEKPSTMDIEFRVPPETLMQIVIEPAKIPEVMKKYGISKEKLSKEIERLSKLIAFRADDMIMV